MTRDWTSTGALGLGAVGLGLGAGLMYLLDPQAGRRRRHEIGQRAGRAGRRAGEGTGRLARDLGHRAEGLWAAASRRFRDDEAGGETVAARVRSRLGRVVSHPGAIDVSVEEGRVTLAGPILASEAEAALDEVRGVTGVEMVDDRLDRFDSPEWVPALQGGTRPGRRAGNWGPGMRLLAGASAGALVAYGLRRRAARGGDGELVRVRKTIAIDAPVTRVFEQWSRLEHFPRFMSGVKEVRDVGPARSHWRVEGPAGAEVEWDAETTAFVPGRRIAWKSLPGSVVSNTGDVRFEPIGEEATRVSVELSYTPPGGLLGHAAASLFGTDPKSRLDEDLLRMKTFIEAGQPPRTAERRDML